MEKRIKKYLAIFEQEESGGYSIKVPDLPGCFSQGETFEEAKRNISEAIDLYLEDITENEKDLFEPNVEKAFAVVV